jgi:hypothetical protein
VSTFFIPFQHNWCKQCLLFYLNGCVCIVLSTLCTVPTYLLCCLV